MKTINGLNGEIKDLKGVVIKSAQNENLTPKHILVEMVGSQKAASGSEAIKLVALGMKLMEHIENSIEVEDADYESLKRAVDTNAPNYVALIQAAAARLFVV